MVQEGKLEIIFSDWAPKILGKEVRFKPRLELYSFSQGRFGFFFRIHTLTGTLTSEGEEVPFVLSLMSFLQPLELSDLIKLQITVMIKFLQCSDKLPK